MRKLLSLITAGCFLASFVFPETLHAVLDTNITQRQFEQPPENDIIPRQFGKITGGDLFDSRQLVINIQDLHCNAEVQRNIASILERLDKKYRLGKVYVEGGYGDVDTSWLCGIQDNRLKSEIMDQLLDQGRFTGSEYYSVASHQPHLLEGIEDKAIHKANIVRLGRILERKAFYETRLGELTHDLKLMQARYFGSQNKRLNRLTEKYRAGSLSADKYYRNLLKYAETINRDPSRFHSILPISMDRFPEMRSYLELARTAQGLKYDRISRQLASFAGLLKTRLSFDDYRTLVENTGNFADRAALYGYLAQFAHDPAFNAQCRSSFPDLYRFLEYTEKSGQLNPVKLVEEERRLVEDVRLGLSRDIDELEISYLTDLFGCFRDYLTNRLSANDYQYFVRKFDSFKSLWGKYALTNRMRGMEPDFAFLDEFYEVNCRRNTCFLEHLKLTTSGGSAGAKGFSPKTLARSLGNSEIIVVIAGGFHTEGLRELLRGKKISCISVTPCITRGIAGSDLRYTDLARYQAKLFGSPALALALGSPDARVVSFTAKEIVVVVNGEKITLRRGAGRELAFEPAGTVVTADKAAIARAVQEALDITDNIRAFSNPLGSCELIYQLKKLFACQAGTAGLFVDACLLRDIVSDPSVQEVIGRNEGVPLDELNLLPDYFQELIKGHAEAKEKLLRRVSSPVVAAIATLLYEKSRPRVIATPSRHKRGDSGRTSLYGGKEVSKASLRVNAYGEIDELNAVLGIVRAEGLPSDIEDIIIRIQGELYELGAELATPDDAPNKSSVYFPGEHADVLEREIQRWEATLQPPPASALSDNRGDEAAVRLDQALSVCRTAGQRVEELATRETVSPVVTRYLGLLSRHLSLMAKIVDDRNPAKAAVRPAPGSSGLAVSGNDACGMLEELNVVLGAARAEGLDSDIEETIARIQGELSGLSGELATADLRRLDFPESRLASLDREIQRWEETLPPLTKFVLPGYRGARAAAQLNLARTVCRRAERRIVELAGNESIPTALLGYLNRLSYHLFVMTRVVNDRNRVEETTWSMPKRPLPASVADAWAKARLGKYSREYREYTVETAPRWEELVFRFLGIGAASTALVHLFAADPCSVIAVTSAISAVLFSAAHIAANWIAGRNKPQEERRYGGVSDTAKDFAVYLVPSLLFTVIFSAGAFGLPAMFGISCVAPALDLVLSLISYGVTAAAHRVYNILVLEGRLPRWMKVAAVMAPPAAVDVDDIEHTAKILSAQDANVVFEREKKTGRWIFRRGPILLETDNTVNDALGKMLEKRGCTAILISLRSPDARDLQGALGKALSGRVDLKDALKERHIKSTYDIKRVLMVAPYGDMEGQPLKYSFPHRGVETLAYRMIRETDDVDALVYNPNLSTVNDLYAFVRDNRFDVIGISVLSSVLMANLEILGRLSLLSPDSIFVAGGNELAEFPINELFGSWPVDVMSYGTGDSLLDLVIGVASGRPKAENLRAMRSIDNLAVNIPGEEPAVTAKSSCAGRVEDIYSKPMNEVPFVKPDLTHHRHYKTFQGDGIMPVQFDRIGRNPVRVPYGNYCKGNCIYCGTTRNTIRNLTPQEVVKRIRAGGVYNDSVHFESADFLYDPMLADPLLRELARDKDIRRIPKLAIARVDEVGDGEILQRMADAGFQIVAFGIESFDDEVLRRIGKQTTASQNIEALEYTISAGIKPGLNLMLFTPWDTVGTTLNTIDESLRFMEKGAYINVVPYIMVGYGRPVSRMKDIITYETYDFPGLKKPFVFPRSAKPRDRELLDISNRAMKKLAVLEENNDYPQWAIGSVTIYSLMIFKAFLLALKEDGKGGDIDGRIRRVDEAIARVIRAERSSILEDKDPLYSSITETKYDPYNKLLARATLFTEDRKELQLILSDSYPYIGINRKLPGSFVYNVYEVAAKGEKLYRGYVVLRTDESDAIVEHEISIKPQRADVFIHRALVKAINQFTDNPGLLNDPGANALQTGAGLVPHYHLLPSEVSFGKEKRSDIFKEVPWREAAAQVHATFRQGFAGLAKLLAGYLPAVSGNTVQAAAVREATPALAISDMDLTQFPSDENAADVIAELGAKALKYKTAAVSIYPRHIDYLPVKELESAGIHRGVVVAFPEGLNRVDIPHELDVLKTAVEKGADEVDLVMDIDAVLRDDIVPAEESLAAFSLGVEKIKRATGKPVRVKTILEVSALKTENNIRLACRTALKYSNMIKMVSGFPVPTDNGNKGRGSLEAARIMLEEILEYYKNTGILRGMKITGGISDWDNPREPDRSAKRYYDLVREVLGEHLGGHYLFERDLFRIGGYGSLSNFLSQVRPEHCAIASSLMPFDPAEYRYLDIPVSNNESSLDIDAYTGDRVPEEMQAALRGRQYRVEIHRGSSGATAQYLQNLVYRGYDVRELTPRNRGLYYKYYKVEKDGEQYYIVGSLLGETRELFMLQMLFKYYGYPASQLAIRVFDEGGLRTILNGYLGRYAGNISQAVILHEIDKYASLVAADPDIGVKIIDRIKGDYLDAIVLERKDGQLVLLYDMQYTNGSHIAQVVDYFADSAENQGLGVKDITVHGACGGIGDGINLNDLIVYSDIYWNDGKLDGIPENDINMKKLTRLLPEGVAVHRAPIYDIPTVLSGSAKLVAGIYKAGGGGMELEVAHAAQAVARHADVRFHAFYEVHDKPAVSLAAKNNALGGAVPGYRDPDKRNKTWISLATYLFGNVPSRGGSMSVHAVPAAQRDINRWTGTEDFNGTAVRAAGTIQRIAGTGGSNVIFLGNGEGKRYYAGICGALKGKEPAYLDAFEALPLLKKGFELADILPIPLRAGGEYGTRNARLLFIDNIDIFLQDDALKEQFDELIAASNIFVIGYMTAKAYPAVESRCSGRTDRNAVSFDALNFEFAGESNPAIKDQRIVVLGATGLVGSQVMKELKRRGFSQVTGVSLRGDPGSGIISADLTDRGRLKDLVEGSDYVINCAVNLDFSGMQSREADRHRAWEVNVGIPQSLRAIRYAGKVIQLSSFYVFGHNDQPVATFAKKEPLSVYGQQKLEAERDIKETKDYAIVRLGPIFGNDMSGRQKQFYSAVVRQLENKRQGKSSGPVRAATYPVSPILSAGQAAEGIVSILESGYSGVAQLSGKERYSAPEQARLIAGVYNAEFGTDLAVDIDVRNVRREESPTPDAAMASMITPDVEKGILDLIDDVRMQDRQESPGGVIGDVAALEKLADVVLMADVAGGSKTVLKPVAAGEDLSAVDEGMFVVKPGGTFNKRFIGDVLRRLRQNGYVVAGVKIFSGEELKKREVFRRQQRAGYDIARKGAALFTGKDYAIIDQIYDNKEVEDYCGIPFKDIAMVSAYDAVDKFGLSEEEVIELWAQGYQQGAYQKNNFRGINKLSSSGKYVYLVRHDRVNNGKPFLLINGFFIHMKHLDETPGSKTAAFLIRGIDGESRPFKDMRERFLGDKAPSDCPPGSIRRDVVDGKLPLSEKVPFWRSVTHMSSGPFESLMEQAVWFDTDLAQITFGKLLMSKGYSREEIEYFVTDPDIRIGGAVKPLFSWTEKMGSKEAAAFIARVFPPFYNAAAMPTMSFSEYLQCLKRHNEGTLSCRSNRVDADRISASAADILDYTALNGNMRQRYQSLGNDLIRQGKVAQVLPMAGTSGRWFGYDVPEEKRTRFMSDVYSYEGRDIGFAELKLGNTRWAARAAGGRIKVWYMDSELNRGALRDYLDKNGCFGIDPKDIRSYTSGSMPRMNPTRQDLKAEFPDKSDEWIDQRIAENGGEGGVFRFEDGSTSKKTAGHFDVIASLFLSKELLRMAQQGIEYIYISDPTDLGAVIDGTLLGMLAESGKGVLHALAGKDRIFTVRFPGSTDSYTVTLRDGKTVFSSLPAAMVPVIENGEVVKILDTRSGQDHDAMALIDKSLEKVGTLVDLDHKPQILEGFRFPRGYDQDRLPYCSTALQIIKVHDLLKLFEVTLPEYEAASSAELLEKNAAAAAKLQTYVELKEVLDERTGGTRIAAQLSRLSGDVTGLLATQYVLVDRDGGKTPCGFIPFKNKGYIEKNIPAVRNVLSGNVILKDGKVFRLKSVHDLRVSGKMLGDDKRPKAISPANLAMVNRWANEGKTAMDIALRTGTVLEYGWSFFNPVNFVRSHKDKRGPLIVVLTGLACGAGACVAVVLGLWTVLTPAPAIAYGIFAGLVVGSLANITTHALLDWHYITVAGLVDAVRRFGAASIDDNGEVHTHVYLVDRMPGDPDAWNLRNTGLMIDGRPVWASTSLGALVVVADGRDSGGVAQLMNETIMGKGPVPGSARVLGRFKRLCRQADSRLDFAELRPGITIDHTSRGRRISNTVGDGMVVTSDWFADEEGQHTVSRRLGGLLAVRNAEQAGMADNIFIKLDDLRSMEELTGQLKAFKVFGNGRMIIDQAAVNGLSEQQIQRITEYVGKSGVNTYVDLGNDDSRKGYFQTMGFSGYALTSGGAAKICEFRSGARVAAEVITGYGTVEQLHGRLSGSRKLAQILNLSDLVSLIEGGEHSILDRAALADMLKTMIADMAGIRAMSVEYVQRVGYAWNRDQLPSPPADTEALWDAVRNGTADDVAAALGVRDNEQSVGIYLEKIRYDLESSGDNAKIQELQKAFLTAIVEKMLAKAVLDRRGISAGLADQELELVLGRALLQQKLLRTEGSGVSVSVEEFLGQNKYDAAALYSRLNVRISGLRPSAEPRDINALVELIPALCEPRMVHDHQEMYRLPDIDMNGFKDVLTAA